MPFPSFPSGGDPDHGPTFRNDGYRFWTRSRVSEETVNEIAAIFGFVLLAMTWLALRGMDDRKPRSRSRR